MSASLFYTTFSAFSGQNACFRDPFDKHFTPFCTGCVRKCVCKLIFLRQNHVILAFYIHILHILHTQANTLIISDISTRCVCKTQFFKTKFADNVKRFSHFTYTPRHRTLTARAIHVLHLGDTSASTKALNEHVYRQEEALASLRGGPCLVKRRHIHRQGEAHASPRGVTLLPQASFITPLGEYRNSPWALHTCP